MSNYTNLNDLFTDLANAIREKKNTTEVIIADNFPSEIESLRTGFDYNNNNVVAIPDHAFYGCEDLKNVDCLNLENIGAHAFENCNNLESVTLYDSVTGVGENAFKGCNCIIYIKANSIPDTWHENWNPDNCPVICGEPIETWDISATSNDNVIAKLYGINGKYTLYIDGYGNMKNYSSSIYIPWKSYNENIVNSIITDGVTSIGDSAFQGCTGLTSINIPDSVTSISDDTFAMCTNLTSINIHENNNVYKSIDGNLYSKNGETLIRYAIGKTDIEFTIPDGVTSIGKYAFQSCSGLTSINIPDSVTSIAYSAFSHCTKLTSINIPDSVTSIRMYAFWNCTNLTSINIPDSVTSISDYTFYGCTSLTSITIPDGVTSIRDDAFSDCTGLTSIIIPDSVTSIGYRTFKNCSSLTSINYIGTISQWNSILFGPDWKFNTGNYTIHCTDGDIAKDGTITYHTT